MNYPPPTPPPRREENPQDEGFFAKLEREKKFNREITWLTYAAWTCFALAIFCFYKGCNG